MSITRSDGRHVSWEDSRARGDQQEPGRNEISSVRGDSRATRAREGGRRASESVRGYGEEAEFMMSGAIPHKRDDSEDW